MDARQWGGWAALLFGVVMVVSLALISVPFATAPPAALAPTGYEARVAFAAGLPSSTLALLKLGFGLEFLAALLLVPALLAVRDLAAEARSDLAGLATATGGIGIVFFVVEHIPRFVLLQLANAYGAASESQRAAIGAGNAVAEAISSAAGGAFSWFFGATLLLFGFALARSIRSAWLGRSAVVVGLVGLVAGVAWMLSYELGFVELPALLLVIAWFMAAGTVIVRRGPTVQS